MNLRSSFTLSPFFFLLGGGSSICRQSFHSMLFFKLAPVWTIPPLLCLLSCCPTHEVETPRIFLAEKESLMRNRGRCRLFKKPHQNSGAVHQRAAVPPLPPRHSALPLQPAAPLDLHSLRGHGRAAADYGRLPDCSNYCRVNV